MQWAIKVPGIPMPKGSIRPIIRDERVLMIPDTRHRKEFEAWKEALQVGGALIAQQLPAPLDEPVGVSIVFTLPAHKTRAWPYMKPSRAPVGVTWTNSCGSSWTNSLLPAYCATTRVSAGSEPRNATPVPRSAMPSTSRARSSASLHSREKTP